MLLDIEGTALDLQELLRPLTTGRSLRSSEQGLLAAPRSSLKTKGECVFAAVTPPYPGTTPTMSQRNQIIF